MTIAEKITRAKNDLDEVYTAGYEKGKAEVIPSGDYSEGYEAGLNSLWDSVQYSGTRTDYSYAFANWYIEYIRPPYKVVPKTVTGIANAFLYCKGLKKLEAEYFDLSQKTYGTGYNRGYDYMCAVCTDLEEIEDIGLVPQCSYQYAFSSCSKLHTIAKLGSDETTTFTDAFAWCNALKNITIEGTIGKSISFAQSPLTADSAISVITHLKSYRGTSNAYSQTLTFSASTWAALDGLFSPANTTWRYYVEQELAWNT